MLSCAVLHLMNNIDIQYLYFAMNFIFIYT